MYLEHSPYPYLPDLVMNSHMLLLGLLHVLTSLWSGSQHRKEQDHDQLHEQYQCRYQQKRPNAGGGDQCQIPGAALCMDGTCSAEIRIRIAWAMAAMASLNGICQNNIISFKSKLKCTHLLLPPYSSMAVRHGACLLNLGKGSRLSRPSASENFSASPTWSTRPATGFGARSASLWVHRNLFWQLPRDRNLHGSGMSHATTELKKKKNPSGHFGAWTMPRSGEEILERQP